MLREKPTTHKYLSCDIFSQHETLTREQILQNNTLDLKFTQGEMSIDLSQVIRYPRLGEYLQILESSVVGNFPFICQNMSYTTKIHNIKLINPQNPGLLLPIKDSIELLEFTLSNLCDSKVNEVANITIIDDRSEDPKSIKELADKHGVIYIRVDYPSEIFNFSMLNNIGAFLYHKLDHEDIILWNADLWTPDKKTVPTLLKRYKKLKKTGTKLAGTKLLYPTDDFCYLVDGDRTIKELSKDFSISIENLKEINPLGKIQYGGGSFVVTTEFLKQITHVFMSPVHYGRFSDKENTIVNIDRETRFVTGAFQIIDLPTFIEIGGFCPSLSCSHQDADLCLRMTKRGDKVQYIGKDVFLYHAESLIISSKLEKNGVSLKHAHSGTRNKLISDEIIYSLLWNYYFFTGQLPL